MNNIRRIAGSNRFETAAKIIETLTMKADSVYIANGNGFADALTGSVLAAKHNAPLLLVNSDSLPWATKRIITNNPGANYTILGGAAAVDQKVASEMAGLMR
jgi:putative cell wall-binding protein